jgi:predicted nucleotidyltransferase
MLHKELFASWVARLRSDFPQAVAILTHGSYARGQQQRHSDLDLDIIFLHEPDVGYHSMIVEQPNGSLLHATIGVHSLADWLERFDQPESEEWALFLAAREVTRLLWATPKVARQLEGKLTLELPASPQLQDLIEGACKVRNAFAQADELEVRLAAQNMALRCPAIIGILNPPVVVNSNAEAMQAALAMPNVPEHYCNDLMVCMGLSANATTMADVHMCALRLAIGILVMLRPHAAQLAGMIEPNLPEYLANGQLMRLLTDK